MKRTSILQLALPLAALASCAVTPDYGRPLGEGESALIPVPADEIPDFRGEWDQRETIYASLDNSIDWTRRRHAEQFFPIAGIVTQLMLPRLG